MGWLLDPFDGAIMQRALVEVLVLAVACGPLGVWILLFRQTYAAESIAHGMLPGLVLAAVAGAPLVLGAAGGVLVAALGIALVARDARLGADTAVAVVVSGLFGLGAILALSPSSPPRLQEILFGDLLGVTGGDLLVAGGLAAGVGCALALSHRSLSLVAFERGSAPSLGARPAVWELALLAVLAVTTVAAVQGLGNLLLLALIVAPATAALRVGRRLSVVLVSAAGLAAVAGVSGLVVSYHLAIATGAAVALCAVIVAGAAAMVGACAAAIR